MSKSKKSKVKVIAKKVMKAVKEGDLKFFTKRALENNDSKRVKVFKAINSLAGKINSKPILIDLTKILKDKDEKFIATSLSSKLEYDLPAYNSKLKGIKIRNKEFTSSPENKNAVVKSLEVSLVK